MYVGRDWDPLDTGLEADTFAFDFVNDIEVGETISSVAWSIAVVRGVDASAASRLLGSPSFVGTKVFQSIDVRNAPAEVYYRLTATIITNLSPGLTLWSHFWSRAPD